MKSLFLKIIFALVLSRAVHSASAQSKSAEAPIIGRAPYAITHKAFNCSAYTQANEGIGPYGVSLLWNTFGDSYACLDEELKNPRVIFVELHLINGPCVRNKRCGNYESLFGYTVKSLRQAVNAKDPVLKAKIEATAEEAAKYLLSRLRPEVPCFISPILETNLSREQSVVVQEWVAPYFKGRCNFVWNPVSENPGLPIQGATVSEAHGVNAVFEDDRCIANVDGGIVSSAEGWRDFFKKYASCRASFAWSLDDNCIDPNVPWQDPRARSCANTGNFEVMRQGILLYQQP